MLHVIFVILKIIGIVVGALFALLLFLVGIILFVPVRYRVRASKYDTIQAKARVSWLCRIVSLQFTYSSEEENYTYCLRIFGYPLIDSSRPPREKKEKTKKEKVKKEKIKKNKTVNSKKSNEKKNKKLDNKTKNQDRIETENTIKIEDKELSISEPVKESIKESIKEDNSLIKLLDKDDTNIENANEKEKESIFRRITKPIRNIIEKVKDIFRKIRNAMQSIRNIFSNIKEKIYLVKEFLEAEENRKGIGRVYASIKKTLKHVLPYRVKGVIKVGLDDPCSTGYLLGALSMIYPIYADKIQIIPEFQEEVLEGKVDVKGRIRACTLLIIGIKLILNDSFKTLLKNVKELKEEF